MSWHKYLISVLSYNFPPLFFLQSRKKKSFDSKIEKISCHLKVRNPVDLLISSEKVITQYLYRNEYNFPNILYFDGFWHQYKATRQKLQIKDFVERQRSIRTYRTGRDFYGPLDVKPLPSYPKFFFNISSLVIMLETIIEINEEKETGDILAIW